jgi:LCP family protein required for cell wall assembly
MPAPMISHPNGASTSAVAPDDVHAATRPTTIRQAASRRGACLPPALIGALLGLALSAYFLLPLRTTVLLLGIDRAPAGTDVSRSDTMILMTFLPARPYVGMLSIPRDLWVTIPGIGPNRINTAHFFAEASRTGTGPAAAERAVQDNLGVRVHGSVRVRFDAVRTLVDALGGVEVDLPVAESGYPAGPHRLNGSQALSFVRDRMGSDDFFRMGRGQLFLRSIGMRMLDPRAWPGLIAALPRLAGSIDTDVPAWEWPRLALTLARVGWGGIDARVLARDMVTPTTTSGGAQVLLPDWGRINPLLFEMFGQ